MKIALAGNPNSGKTTLFNALTGSTQYVGNWPGVTVEKKEGKIKEHKNLHLIDLPGIYSLSPYTLEEVVSRKYLLEETPDVLINIVDATNLERNLYLTTQLLELAIPTVIALNMMDVINKRGETIDVAALSKELGCPIVEISALREQGSHELIQAVVEAENKKEPPPNHSFDPSVEHYLSKIATLIKGSVPPHQERWYTIRLFERDEDILKNTTLSQEALADIERLCLQAEDAFDDDTESIITNERYQFVARATQGTYTKKAVGALSPSDKIDKIVTHHIFALPIFMAVMFLVYFLAISTIGTGITDWVNDVLFGGLITNGLTTAFANWGVSAPVTSLVIDGIVAGVGAVIGFLPQMMVLFFLLAILEDSGYMARIAFIMDKIFRRFGLSGKSFIPMLVTTGCGVPGIMAARTIESERDRRMTVITTTFVPCSAKLPVISLIGGALFANSWWVAPSIYFMGIASVLISGIILKKTKLFKGDASPFVMELPPYRFPNFKSLILHVWDKVKHFIKRAGSVIFISSVLIWFLSNFNWRLSMVNTNDSILATLGGLIAPLFTPLGWGDWRTAVATISGLVAKENVVGTLGVLFGFAQVSETGQEFWRPLQQALTPLAGYSFLVFNMLCAPCFAAIGAMRKELGAKWMWIGLGYQTGFAYLVSLFIYQIGRLLSGGGFTVYTVVTCAFLALLLLLLFRPDPNKKKPKPVTG